MPHCVACKTSEGVELYKGRFFCPDHRGSPEEIEAKIPFVDPFAEILSGDESNSKNAIRAEITREYLKRQKGRESDFAILIPNQSDMSRKELRIRYG